MGGDVAEEHRSETTTQVEDGFVLPEKNRPSERSAPSWHPQTHASSGALLVVSALVTPQSLEQAGRVLQGTLRDSARSLRHATVRLDDDAVTLGVKTNVDAPNAIAGATSGPGRVPAFPRLVDLGPLRTDVWQSNPIPGDPSSATALVWRFTTHSPEDEVALQLLCRFFDAHLTLAFRVSGKEALGYVVNAAFQRAQPGVAEVRVLAQSAQEAPEVLAQQLLTEVETLPRTLRQELFGRVGRLEELAGGLAAELDAPPTSLAEQSQRVWKELSLGTRCFHRRADAVAFLTHAASLQVTDENRVLQTKLRTRARQLAEGRPTCRVFVRGQAWRQPREELSEEPDTINTKNSADKITTVPLSIQAPLRREELALKVWGNMPHRFASSPAVCPFRPVVLDTGEASLLAEDTHLSYTRFDHGRRGSDTLSSKGMNMASNSTTTAHFVTGRLGQGTIARKPWQEWQVPWWLVSEASQHAVMLFCSFLLIGMVCVMHKSMSCRRSRRGGGHENDPKSA